MAITEENKEKCRLYYLANKQKISENRKIYYLNNKEKISEKTKSYADNNKDKVYEIQRSWYLKNKDSKIEKSKEYAKKNPEKGVISMNKRRFYQKNTSDNTITKLSLLELLIKQNYKCNICQSDISKEKHIDHIISLSKNGAHSISNIQYLCPTCNRRKGVKDNFKINSIIKQKNYDN